MTKRQERIVFLLMAANAIVFAFVFLMVSRNYRLAADDFHYLMKTQELGVWKAMLFYYDNWNPRWSSTLVSNLSLSSIGPSKSALGFFLATYLLGLVAIGSMMTALSKGLALRFSNLQVLILSTYLLAGLFYSSFAQNDTWFWITVVPMYLWGCFVAVLAGSLLLRSWFAPVRYSFIALGFIYVGGASESAAICSLITLFFLGFITHGKTLRVPFDRNALHVATIACFAGFAICLLGQGIHIRNAHLPKIPLSDRVIIGFWNYFRFNFWQIPMVIPIVILMVSPFGFFGRRQLMYQLISIKGVFWTNRKLWGWADLTIVLLAFALAMVMGEMGPTRTWVPLTFIILSVGVCIAYSLGTWVYITTKGKLFLLVVIGQILLIGYQAVNGYQQISNTSAYAQAVDSRMQSIPERMKLNETIIQLSPLPDSGWLLSAEITADSSHFTNRHLKSFFGNGQAFVLEDSVTSTTE